MMLARGYDFGFMRGDHFANFSDADWTTLHDQLVTTARWYALDKRRADDCPRPSARLKDLRRIAKLSVEMQQAINGLDMTTRADLFAGLEAVGSIHHADRVEELMPGLALGATVARKSLITKAKPGQPKKHAVRGIIGDLVAIFERHKGGDLTWDIASNGEGITPGALFLIGFFREADSSVKPSAIRDALTEYRRESTK